MAVSKELLARYKEMKAKGINITLTELKKQMEEEENMTSSPIEQVSIESAQAFESNPTQSENTWTTTYSNNNYSETVEQQTQPSYEQPVQPSYEQPVQPSYEQQTQPSYEQPVQPSYEQPVQPSYEQPVQPSYEQPSYSQQTYGQPSYGVVEPSNSLDDQPSSSSFSSSSVQKPEIPQNNLEQTSPETYSSQSFSNSFDVSVNSSFFRPNVVNEQVPAPSVTTQTYEADAVNAPTRKYALIGYPLGHSLSSFIHEAGFKSLGLKASYEILETPPETLVDRVKFFKSQGYRGFNVTIPLKLPITMFLDSVDASADIVNAVNTVVIDPQTREMRGYNTDVLGFRNAIPEDVTLCGKVAGVLGTGGAARAAITALAQAQMKEIKLFTRNVPNSLELVNYLRKTFPNVEFNTYQIERIRDLSDIDLLVNTTPIGMLGRAADFTPVEENELRTLKQGAVVYDVIYNPKKTILLKLAQKYGYRTINGVDMFIHQALAAEQIWTGRTPDFKDMKIAALENL